MITSYQKIIAEHCKWLDTLGFSAEQVRYSQSCLYYFFQWLENNKIQSIAQLTDKHITDYFNHLETRPNIKYKGLLLSKRTLNKQFLAIDKLLEFLHQYGMKKAPFANSKRFKEDPEERVFKLEILTQQEIKTLYDSIEHTYSTVRFEQRQEKHYEMRLILTLFYGCGLRHSEGFNLQIQDIDFDKRTVFVRQGKGYKDRIVPMNEGVYKNLQDYIYNFRSKYRLNHNRLFLCGKNTILNKIKLMQAACDDDVLKSKRIFIHLLRHSIATHLLQNGMSIENVALFLGHTSLDSTQIYTHLI